MLNLRILAAIFLLAPVVNATYVEHSPWFDDSQVSLNPEFIEQKKVPRKYEWLFKELMPEDTRSQHLKEAERSFVVHLKDSQKYFPHPQKIQSKNLSSQLPYTATGSITYVGFFPAKYFYDVEVDEKGIHILANIHFKTKNKELIKVITPKIFKAARFWESHSQASPLPVYFHFQIVGYNSMAHLSVDLISESTRGPYFLEWSAHWNINTIAHEFGHIMGLGDEYRTLSGKSDCLKKSLMCSSYSGKPTFQHYYHILRRALNGWKVEH